MDFTFTEEQRMLAGAFRRLADEICSPRRLRAAAEEDGRGTGHELDGDNAVPDRGADDSDGDARWQRIAELGLPGVLAPEGHGGLGLTDIDFVLIAEEAGHAALPESLVEHAGIAVPALAELADHPHVADTLGSLAAGRTRVAVAHPVNPFVLDAARANYLLL